MAANKRSQAEILENVANSQNATVELLRLMREEIREEMRRNGEGQNEEGNSTITKALAEFRKAQPPTFRGTHDPMVAQEWMNQLEKIFTVVGCTNEQKLTLAVYKLEGEGEYWWKGAEKLMESKGVEISWTAFQNAFYEKYFPESVRNEKEAEFIQLKQGSMTVSEYEAKFEELSKFSTYLKYHYDEAWKTCHFERGLRSEIRKKVGPLEIRSLAQHVNKCRLIEKYIQETNAEKEIGEKKKRELGEPSSNKGGSPWKKKQKKPHRDQ